MGLRIPIQKKKKICLPRHTEKFVRGRLGHSQELTEESLEVFIRNPKVVRDSGSWRWTFVFHPLCLPLIVSRRRLLTMSQIRLVHLYLINYLSGVLDADLYCRRFLWLLLVSGSRGGRFGGS